MGSELHGASQGQAACKGCAGCCWLVSSYRMQQLPLICQGWSQESMDSCAAAHAVNTQRLLPQEQLVSLMQVLDSPTKLLAMGD